ncbi:hypothetical protein B0H14DRAFT_3765149 [Mycena olivaceomarginata]|nr:hypothetical protein B0H14DRAFT_3765149 [Mycena olivaceomarginata]
MLRIKIQAEILLAEFKYWVKHPWPSLKFAMKGTENMSHMTPFHAQMTRHPLLDNLASQTRRRVSPPSIPPFPDVRRRFLMRIYLGWYSIATAPEGDIRWRKIRQTQRQPDETRRQPDDQETAAEGTKDVEDVVVVEREVSRHGRDVIQCTDQFRQVRFDLRLQIDKSS